MKMADAGYGWNTFHIHGRVFQVHGMTFHIHGRSFQSHQTIWKSPKSRQQSVSTHYQDCFLHLDSLLHKDLSKIPYGFLTNQSYICHSWFRLNSLFFETPCIIFWWFVHFCCKVLSFVFLSVKRFWLKSKLRQLFCY